MKADLIGIPLDLGAKNLGVDVGPNAFRYQGIVEKLEQASIKVNDLGNITCTDRKQLEPVNPRLKYIDEILRVSEISADYAFKSIHNKSKLISLGGDHSITMGIFSGVSTALNKDIGMIYFDAHGDMNTDKTTLTGNIHGMPLSALMGYGDSRLINIYKKGTKLDKNNMLHIGGCDFDQGELDLVNKEKLNLFTIENMLAFGMKPLFDKIDRLNKQAKNIYISLDLDSLDSVYAPGTGMPNKGGLTYREITAIANFIGQNCNVVGIDVVEYNPLLDDNHKTAELAIELIARFLGKNYSWYSTYLKDNSG